MESIISGLLLGTGVFLIGVLIGLAGLAISFANYLSNKQFQKRKDQREQEEHELKIAKLRGQWDAKQD